jgi:hypothetical protein
MGIHSRGVLALATTRAGAFNVTPKDGVEQGGWRALRSLGLLTTAGTALAVAWILRWAATLGVLDLPRIPDFALVITLLLGAWELGCIVFVLGGIVRRRQLRNQYRFPVALQARIARTSTIVPVLDMSMAGTSFESPLRLEAGQQLELLTRLPDAKGVLHDIELPVHVESCRRLETGRFRVGCRLGPVSEQTHTLIVEYCYVVQPAYQLGATREPAQAARVPSAAPQAS